MVVLAASLTDEALVGQHHLLLICVIINNSGRIFGLLNGLVLLVLHLLLLLGGTCLCFLAFLTIVIGGERFLLFATLLSFSLNDWNRVLFFDGALLDDEISLGRLFSAFGILWYNLTFRLFI